jgi:hypothetical protein
MVYILLFSSTLTEIGSCTGTYLPIYLAKSINHFIYTIYLYNLCKYTNN